MVEVTECVHECVHETNNFFSVLESREARVALLKAGFSVKDIESLYLEFNGIVVIDVNWQEREVDSR